MSSVPRPAAVGLLATLAVTSAALVAFARGAPVPPAVYLALFTVLFAGRVVGQIGVAAARPSWLPPMGEWNFVPYRILLPAQMAILVLMSALAVGVVDVGEGAGRALVACAIVYWLAMAVRYALRMTRRPAERWLGGTIPIVFHGVLAAFLFVLGASAAGWA